MNNEHNIEKEERERRKRKKKEKEERERRKRKKKLKWSEKVAYLQFPLFYHVPL